GHKKWTKNGKKWDIRNSEPRPAGITRKNGTFAIPSRAPQGSQGLQSPGQPPPALRAAEVHLLQQVAQLVGDLLWGVPRQRRRDQPLRLPQLAALQGQRGGAAVQHGAGRLRGRAASKRVEGARTIPAGKTMGRCTYACQNSPVDGRKCRRIRSRREPSCQARPSNLVDRGFRQVGWQANGGVDEQANCM